MSATHDHPVHPAVYAAEASAARARAAGHTFRARQEHLEVAANRLYEAGNGEGDALTADHAQTAGRAALTAFESATALTVCADELRALEAEVARLTAALAEAEERAGGPFFASCDEIVVAYGRRLDVVLDDVAVALVEHLEQYYDPDEWAAVVAEWEVEVEHGVHLVPCSDDDGEPVVRVGSRQGIWWYDLRLTVTDGRPVITAERRAGGAR